MALCPKITCKMLFALRIEGEIKAPLATRCHTIDMRMDYIVLINCIIIKFLDILQQ